MSIHENLQRHSAKAGIQSFAAPWMLRHAREGGDCAGMTILAAVMINSRLDNSGMTYRAAILARDDAHGCSVMLAGKTQSAKGTTRREPGG
jgi:hypothetical protein